MIQPDLRLEHADRAQLHAITAMEGYKVLHRIMRAEVDKFIVSLLNGDASDDADILARHKLAKAAAQFYTALTNEVNEQVMLYTAAPRDSDKPRDITEGVIDLGDLATTLEGVPNFFGEEIV